MGIKDIVAKSMGTANPHNVIRACLKALKNQHSPKHISMIRNKKISEIILDRLKRKGVEFDEHRVDFVGYNSCSAKTLKFPKTSSFDFIKFLIQFIQNVKCLF